MSVCTIEILQTGSIAIIKSRKNRSQNGKARFLVKSGLVPGRERDKALRERGLETSSFLGVPLSQFRFSTPLYKQKFFDQDFIKTPEKLLLEKLISQVQD